MSWIYCIKLTTQYNSICVYKFDKTNKDKKIGKFFLRLKEKSLEKYVKCFKKNKDKSPSQPTYLAHKTDIKDYFDI